MVIVMFKAINNPRQKNGDFGKHTCSKCQGKSSAYTKIALEYLDSIDSISLCKSCLLNAVKLIDETILSDCIEKGKERHGR